MDYFIIYRDEYWDIQETTTIDCSDLLDVLKSLIDRWNIIISVFRR